jgi:TolB protein
MKSAIPLLLASVLTVPSLAAARERPIALPYQLTHGISVDPSFSPDGKRLVYITVVAGREQLFVMDADAAHASQLTRDDVDHEDPAWSPDGRRIAYVAVKDGRQVIHVMDADGRGDRALTPASVHVIHPHWHPDSKRLIYCTTDDLDPPRKNEAEIQLIDLATRKITTLISGGINTYPAYSPDGSRIAYRHFVGENSEVFVANADGTNPVNLTNDQAFDGWPAWSPDGRQIAFGSNRRSGYQIFLMGADGSNVRLLANTDGRATAPAWSPDGRNVYFPVCRPVDYASSCEIFVAAVPG